MNLNATPVDILWDRWGVPHIEAPTAAALHYGFGWAQMEAHGDLVLRLYGQARGRAAEYWGESWAEGDRLVRALGVPARAQDWLAAQGEEYRACLEAFARGANDYARLHHDRLSAEAQAALPVTAADLLAHLQRVVHISFVGAGIAPGTAAWSAAGSNAWALGPARTAQGHAILLANPHLPWSDLSLFFEAHLRAPGVDVYGVTLVGLPMLAIAFNPHLGWTHTVNPMDGCDLYELDLIRDGYAWNGGVKAFETRTERLTIRQADGSLRHEELQVRASVHGPVVATRGRHALAVRLVGLDQPGMFAQYWDMARATDLAGFEAALARLQNPFFNVIYADRAGHVLYLFGGRTPVRPGRDWDYWQGIVPGRNGRTLWTATHPYADLPRVLDPPAGWVQNANDPPWLSTWPPRLRPQDFPAYLTPRYMHLRAQQSVALVSQGPPLTFDEVVQRKHSTRVLLADRVLDDLVRAATADGGDLVGRAAAVLSAWDRQTLAQSRGAVLFAAWAETAGASGGIFARPWDPADPLVTPSGLADPATALQALEAAARACEAAYGALDVSWGSVYRLRLGGHDLPANGGPGELGIFRVLSFEPEGDGRFRAVGGDSWVAVVEFSDTVRARALLSYGNSSQPGSPHVGDQLPLLARQELRPVWLSRPEIEANLERRETLDAPGS